MLRKQPGRAQERDAARRRGELLAAVRYFR
jgi:hypothetical protein